MSYPGGPEAVGGQPYGGYPAGGYQPGYPAGGYPPGGGANSSKAVTALVLGILSVVLCGFFAGIPAIIIGGQAKREIQASGGRVQGEGMATAGRVLGWVSLALTAVAILMWVLVFASSSSSTR